MTKWDFEVGAIVLIDRMKGAYRVVGRELVTWENDGDGIYDRNYIYVVAPCGKQFELDMDNYHNRIIVADRLTALIAFGKV